MAVVTTLCMPPLLRWALSRVTLRQDERLRLQTEEQEEKELLPKIERMLVGLDANEKENFAARLAGWLIGARQISSTVLDWSSAREQESKNANHPAAELLFEAAEEAGRANAARQDSRAGRKSSNGHPLDDAAKEKRTNEVPVRDLVAVLQPKAGEAATEEKFAQAILEEAGKGYNMIFLRPRSTAMRGQFQESVERIVHDFNGPVALLFGQRAKAEAAEPLTKILVPTIGADYSRFGAEIAVAIAKGCGATITAVHVSVAPEGNLLRRSARLLRTGRALVSDIEALGQREGVSVEPKALRGHAKESSILRQVERGGHQLIVIGSKSQSTGHLHFGTSAMSLIEQAPCPVLIVKS